MGLLDSVLGAVSGQSEGQGGANPLAGILGSVLAQNGGLQGLAAKFSQSGHGNTFASWVGTGENQPIAGEQVQKALGSDQISAMASRIGVNPTVAAGFIAQYLPMIIDKLTPTGKIDPAADHQQGLAALLPSLLQSLEGRAAAGGSPPV